MPGLESDSDIGSDVEAATELHAEGLDDVGSDEDKSDVIAADKGVVVDDDHSHATVDENDNGHADEILGGEEVTCSQLREAKIGGGGDIVENGTETCELIAADTDS